MTPPRLGTPLSDTGLRVMLLGSGELGKEVAIEAAIKQGWERFIGEDGGFVGMSSFGASAPAPRLYEGFGITADAVVEQVKARL